MGESEARSGSSGVGGGTGGEEPPGDHDPEGACLPGRQAVIGLAQAAGSRALT